MNTKNLLHSFNINDILDLIKLDKIHVISYTDLKKETFLQKIFNNIFNNKKRIFIEFYINDLNKFNIIEKLLNNIKFEHLLVSIKNDNKFSVITIIRSWKILSETFNILKKCNNQLYNFNGSFLYEDNKEFFNKLINYYYNYHKIESQGEIHLN